MVTRQYIPRKTAYWIRRWRLMAGLTQLALAKKAGLSHSNINMIESGVIKNPRDKTVLKIMKALDK